MLLKWTTAAIALVLLISAGSKWSVKSRIPDLAAPTRNWSPQLSEVTRFAPVRFHELATNSQNATQTGATTNFAPELPEPGVYRTAPFDCIVIVPPNHLDEAIAVPPPETAFTMPIFKPELRFIPLREK